MKTKNFISIVISNEEYDQIKEECDAQLRSITSYVRYALNFYRKCQAGKLHSLLSQLAKFADLPSNAWSDHFVAVHKLAQSAKELIEHIDKVDKEIDNNND